MIGVFKNPKYSGWLDQGRRWIQFTEGRFCSCFNGLLFVPEETWFVLPNHVIWRLWRSQFIVQLWNLWRSDCETSIFSACERIKNHVDYQFVLDKLQGFSAIASQLTSLYLDTRPFAVYQKSPNWIVPTWKAFCEVRLPINKRSNGFELCLNLLSGDLCGWFEVNWKWNGRICGNGKMSSLIREALTVVGWVVSSEQQTSWGVNWSVSAGRC